MTDKILVFTTAGSEKNAKNIAETLVKLRLAACVNILPRLTSIYRWEEKIETAEEWLLIIKTIRKNFTAVRDAIKELHTYELPECVSVPIEDGSEAYLKWIANQCRADTPVRLAGSLKKANICGAAGTRAGVPALHECLI